MLLLLLFGVTVEEHVDHGLPFLVARDLATETKDLTGEEPVGKTDGVLTLVVGRDSNINVTERGVSIGKGNDGDVDVRSLLDGLVVRDRVGDDDDTGLTESTGDVVGEGTRGETTSNGLSTGVLGELESSTVTVGTSRDDADVLRLLNGSDDTGSKDQLGPGLANVDDVVAVLAGLPDVGGHGLVQVLGTNVGVGSKHVLDILGGGLENLGNVGHCWRVAGLFLSCGGLRAVFASVQT